jgi:hypothetical protein
VGNRVRVFAVRRGARVAGGGDLYGGHRARGGGLALGRWPASRWGSLGVRVGTGPAVI